MDRGEFPHLTDAQFESVQKMVGIFRGDALRSLTAATPAEQVERIEAFDTYERGLIAHVQGLQAPVAEMKSAQSKPWRLKVNPYETVARNSDKYADALRESEGRGQVSVRLADGTVVNVPGVRMDLAVKFEDFDSTESFLVLDMDKYDLILGMPWLEKHEPWIDWRGKAIGTSRPAVSDRALVSNVPTSVRDWGARYGRQGAYAPEEYWESLTPTKPVEEQYHAFDGVSGRQVRAGAVQLEALPEVSALLNLEELSMKDFLAELKAGEIAEMVLLKPETSPEDLNSSSVMYEDVLECFTLQRATRMGSEILKNPEDPVYPLVQWPLPREQCEVIDAFFAEKAKSGMMRESDIPLTATCFDDIFVHSRAEADQTAMDVHLKHLCRVFEVMRVNKPYANIDMCVFAAEKIKGIGCFFSRDGVIADPRSQNDLRKWLGLANYLPKYGAGIKASLLHPPDLALLDENKSFSAVWDASDYAIGCALMQKDDEGCERIISFQSRQLKAA
ncbi:Reverse transcriptase [Phytophthora palmivora]|uniref:Reverse transcriptase n=1 Tax=Phytophthora palmivora TaxID=4796 RepID=A0A2P4Y1C5_9STRA|nr:Reverse transcriptase [Phytophthora palmivora]